MDDITKLIIFHIFLIIVFLLMIWGYSRGDKK